MVVITITRRAKGHCLQKSQESCQCNTFSESRFAMSITTLNRTTAQLKGMFDEVKSKRQLMRDKMNKGQLKETEVLRLKCDLDTIEFGFNLVEELQIECV